MDHVPERVALLRELLSSINNIYVTEFDTNYNIVSSNYKHFDLFLFFLLCDAPSGLINILPADEHSYFEQENHSNRPLIFTNSIGLTWMSGIAMQDGKPWRIYFLGPVFLDDYSVEKIDRALGKMDVSATIKLNFRTTIKEFPVIDLRHFFEYGIMLHRCITGETISTSDFEYPLIETGNDPEDILPNQHGSYMVESNILKLVEEGNLDFEEEMKKYVSQGGLDSLGGDHLRQAKNWVIVLTALCTSAAIRGGLTPETAYHLRSVYIQALEQAESVGKVTEIKTLMMRDFVKRVRRVKNIAGEVSPQIRSICDYIGLHLKDKLDISALAARLGYADYYFSTKFKREVGCSVSQYANRQRIERAKQMLSGSTVEIQDICYELGYSSQSYFGKVFREATGMSPGEYRESRAT